MDVQTHCLQNKQDLYAEEVISIFLQKIMTLLLLITQRLIDLIQVGHTSSSSSICLGDDDLTMLG